MKTIYGAVLAALAGSSVAREQTFAVMRFTSKGITKGRMDPIVSPGEPSQHVHTVMGGSGFSSNATGEDLMNSQCTNAQIVGDNSAYWFPSLYFVNPDNQQFEAVDVYYVNVYYFFDQTDDDIKAFPPGLKIVAGDAMTRVVPKGGGTPNLDPSVGPINNIMWTCPRSDNDYDPPSWPADSDGSMAGIADPSNSGQGVGFPYHDCDGLYSPLRADIHMPSCYNPGAGLDDYQKNMVFPSDNGSGMKNCPEGHIHVPHLFFEVYWDTPSFSDRWTSNQGSQPFVLSNGDITGFSSHADFFAGWDEDTLQNIIDTCNAGTEGMDKCPGVTVNTDTSCSVDSDVDERVNGPLDALPGVNPLSGWSYGAPDPKPTSKPTTAEPAPQPTLSPVPTSEAVSQAPSEPTKGVSKPGPGNTSLNPIANTVKAETAGVKSCSRRIHTEWETVTVTKSPAPKPTQHAPRHLHGHHLHGHGRLNRRSL